MLRQSECDNLCLLYALLVTRRALLLVLAVLERRKDGGDEVVPFAAFSIASVTIVIGRPRFAAEGFCADMIEVAVCTH